MQAVPKPRKTVAERACGFRDGQLAVLEILDSFWASAPLCRFAKLQANPQLPAATFQFKPPAGWTCSNSQVELKASASSPSRWPLAPPG